MNSKNLLTLEEAMERYQFGFTTTQDADTHRILGGAICNHCGKVFAEDTNGSLEIYCSECRNKFQSWGK